MNKISYRPELDGLRAIAILVVLMFHVGFRDFAGGFVGVDIFFVLSGYLICSQIYLSLEAQSFSVTDFLARRIRRLAMASFLCFFATGIAAYLVFLPSELEFIGQNLIGATTFSNNYVLMGQTGYFENDSRYNPLLHTWSLSIEEQFYLVLAVVLFVLKPSAKVFFFLVCGFFTVSFLLALFSGNGIFFGQERFFSSGLRVWELALGALAFIVPAKLQTSGSLRFLPFVGVALIIATVFLADDTLLWPSYWAIIPNAGAVLVLISTGVEKSFTLGFLRSRLMNYLGRISYGTYLWHWPLIVFLTYTGDAFSDKERVGLVFASFALGAISYHGIENPIRKLRIATSKGRLFLMFGVQFVLLIGLGVFLINASKTAPADELSEVRSIRNELGNYHRGWDACWSTIEVSDHCVFGNEASARSKPDFVVWGDSMANSAFWAFEDYAKARGLNGLLITSPGCAPVKGMARHSKNSAECIVMNDAALALFEKSKPLEIFVFARWSYYFEGYVHHQSDVSGQVGFVGADGTAIEGGGYDLFEVELAKTLGDLSKRHNVVAISQVPTFPFSVPQVLLQEKKFGTEPPSKSKDAFLRRSGRSRDVLEHISADAGIRLIDLIEDFCPAENCELSHNGVPVLSDHVHLSSEGNRMLSERLKALQ